MVQAKIKNLPSIYGVKSLTNNVCAQIEHWTEAPKLY